MSAGRIVAAFAIVGVAAIAGAAIFVYAGAYNIAATVPHFSATHWLLEVAMRRSVRRHAATLAVPALDGPDRVDPGARLYREHCVACHGAPGVAPEPFALGFVPLPANLAHAAREWPPAELFWVVKHGIKMTGMPAWSYRLADAEIWSVVAFVRHLPHLSPADYAALMRTVPAGAPVAAVAAEPASPSGDAARGKLAIHQYACGTCHRIPGIAGAIAPVGPPLDGIATRGLVAGRLANTPANMERWLREPRALNPGTAMPDLGVTERDARDIAAYLATLKSPRTR